MKKAGAFELPDELIHDHQKARRLEYWTLGYMITVIILLYFTMGSSQAMKTAWVEDLLTLLPPLCFLIASKVAVRAPNKRFPYGYHRANSIAFLIAAVALFGMGLFLVYDGLSALVKAEHPTINSIRVFGKNIWMGWIMIMALAYSAAGPVILGYLKLPLAKNLHNKVLYTDAMTNKADYLTAAAAASGIIGIGMGWWWADAAAALIISVDIVRDGFTQLTTAVTDLMNRTPERVDEKGYDQLVFEVQDLFNHLDWIKKSEVRLREEGQIYFGEAFVIPAENLSAAHLIEKMDEAVKKAKTLNWRIFDLTVSPLKEIPDDQTERLPAIQSI
jgi:cation diffusion facilitator family transporter